MEKKMEKGKQCKKKKKKKKKKKNYIEMTS